MDAQTRGYSFLVFHHLLTHYEPSVDQSGLTYTEHVGDESVMKALANLLGKQSGACNPISYCSHSLAAFRVRRYTYQSSPRLKWWIDVCYFKSDDIYVIGTVETNLGDTLHTTPSAKEWRESVKTGLDLVCDVPSKIGAYMVKYCRDIATPIKNDGQPPNFLFFSHDPFGGGPFEPIIEQESDDDDEECDD